MKRRKPNPWRPRVDIRRGPGRGGWCAYVKGTGDLRKGARISARFAAFEFQIGASFREMSRRYGVRIVDIENAIRFWDWELRKR